jgi:hypothetical protein
VGDRIILDILSFISSPSIYPMKKQPGDIVAVNHGGYGRREGLVVGSHFDYAVRPSSHPHQSKITPSPLIYASRVLLQGRQVVEIQFEPGDIYHAWYPSVTRVKRTIYTRPKPRTVERHVYW